MIFLFMIILLGLLLIGYMYWEAKQCLLQEQDLYLPDWPENFTGMRVLFVTDFHKRSLPVRVRKRLQDEHFDMVWIGGDLIEDGVPFTQVREQVQFLTGLAPTYFVWGNHDYSVDYRQFDVMLREEGVHVLDNTATSFEAGEDRLWLLGVDDVRLGRDDLRLALHDALGLRTEKEQGTYGTSVVYQDYRLLLSHNPRIIHQLRKEHGIRGVFSGHTHGGQICLPLLGAITTHTGQWFPKYVAGEYTILGGRAKLFISRGLGTTLLPLRLLAKPEIHMFTFKTRS